jgi:hypothetical protein
MTFTISKKLITPLLTLIIGFVLGVGGTLPSNAEETPAPVAVQGEILKVCINLKTGVIRVSNRCDSKTERKTVLGGAGAQGAKGDKGETGATGLTGAQGPQGFTGATGATGSISGLRTQNIDFLSGSSFGCPGFGSSKTVVTDVSVYTSFSGKTTITPYTTRLNGCSITVYTR